MRDEYVPSDYGDLYEHFFSSTNGWVAGVIRRYFPRFDDGIVEDLLHESWLRMHRLDLIGRFDSERGGFGLLVYMAVRSECLNTLEKRKRHPEQIVDDRLLNSSDFWDVIDKDPMMSKPINATQENEVEARMMLQRLDELIRAAAEVGATQRDRLLGPMVEQLVEGKSARKIAEEFGVSSGTISYWRDHIEEGVSA